MDGSSKAQKSVDPDVTATPAAPGSLATQRDSVLLALVGRMGVGDQQALSALYDETSSVVYALTLRILRTPEDAEEALLDTYSRAWKLSRTFDPARGSVITWLIMMARSLAIDRLRSGATKASRTESMEGKPFREPVDGGDPETTAVFSEQRERIVAALEKLPPEQRAAIELAFFGGLSHSELADHLGVPLGTVKTRVRLGLARLRSLLEDLS